MRARWRFGMAALGVAALAALLVGVGQARAEFIITFSQNGPNVVATGKGSIDTAALTPEPGAGTVIFGAGVNPSVADVNLGTTPPANPDRGFAGITGPGPFGTTSVFESADGASGPGVALFGTGAPPELVIPQDYVSGQNLSDSATWDNTTLSGLGLTPGTYVWTWGTGPTADSFTVQIGPAATAAPEPASLTLLSLGAVGLLGYGWRRRQQVVA